MKEYHYDHSRYQIVEVDASHFLTCTVVNWLLVFTRPANNGRNLRSAYRNRNEPAERNNNIGFRLALAHIDVDALFDPIFILSAVWLCGGKKPMPSVC
jgi:hypothetical protein